MADEERNALVDGDIGKLQGRFNELYAELDNLAILAQYGIVIPEEDLLKPGEEAADKVKEKDKGGALSSRRTQSLDWDWMCPMHNNQ